MQIIPNELGIDERSIQGTMGLSEFHPRRDDLSEESLQENGILYGRRLPARWRITGG